MAGTGEWRDVVGYEGRYKVSEFGLINATHNHYRGPLSPRPIRDGYLRVSLSRNGVAKDKLVHVAVAEAFIGPVPEGHEVNHKDLNNTNNHWTNLEYLTHLENVRHARANGVRTEHFGISNGNAKFSDETILAFLHEHAEGKLSVSDLMDKYGIMSKSYAYALIRGEFRKKVA